MYKPINKAYLYGLRVGGLGEVSLAAPHCFCTDPTIIRKFDPKNVHCINNQCGVCAKKSQCPEIFCDTHYEKQCNPPF